MKESELKKITGKYRSQIIAGTLAIAASLAVLIIYHDATIRFTFIVPIFVCLLFYLVMTSEEKD